jgi:hypothetical protein
MRVRWDTQDERQDIVRQVHKVQTWSVEDGYVFDLVTSTDSRWRRHRGGLEFATYLLFGRVDFTAHDYPFDRLLVILWHFPDSLAPASHRLRNESFSET